MIDATDKTLGRMAVQVARLLMGKHKPTYASHMDTGDYVVVINAARARVTGKKAKQKLYHRHSGYPGGLKSLSFEELFSRDPARVVELSVRGMLPHNSLGRAMLKKLKVYAGDDHPHEAQTSAYTRDTERVEKAESPKSRSVSAITGREQRKGDES